MGPTGYSDTWPDFFPELDGDIHPELVEAIGANDCNLSLTLDPESTRLHPHTTRSGQRFGVYLQFDGGQVHGGAYLIVGFDGIGGIPQPGNRPFVSMAIRLGRAEFDEDAFGQAAEDSGG